MHVNVCQDIFQYIYCPFIVMYVFLPFLKKKKNLTREAYFWINMPVLLLLLLLSVCLSGNMWFIFWLVCPDSGRKIYSFIFFLLDLGWVLQCEVLHRCQSTRCRKLAQIYQVCWMLQSAQPRCMSDKWSGMWCSLSGLIFLRNTKVSMGKKNPTTIHNRFWPVCCCGKR